MGVVRFLTSKTDAREADIAIIIWLLVNKVVKTLKCTTFHISLIDILVSLFYNQRFLIFRVDLIMGGD